MAAGQAPVILTDHALKSLITLSSRTKINELQKIDI